MRDVKCIVFGIAAAAFLWFYVLPAEAAPMREQIAAVVNDDIITSTDVDTRLLLNSGGRSLSPSERATAEKTVLDELINETIQRQEARALDITVDDAQIQEAFTAVAAKNNTSPAEFKNRLSGAGVPVEALYDKLETDIAWSQVVRRKLRPQVNISETDIDAVFDTIERAGAEPQYRMAEIVLKDDMMADDAAAEAKMKEIISLLQNGARFSDIARRYSEAAGASRGGDLGYLPLSHLDEDYRPLAMKLEPGQLSLPFKTAKGYHLVLMIDKKGPAPGAQPAVPAPVPEKAPTQVRLQQIFLPVGKGEPDALKNTKMARAAALGNELSGCAAMKEAAAHFTSPLTGDLGLVDLADLPEPVAAEISGLDIGEASRPMVNSKGIFVLMVCERPRAETVAASLPAPTAPPDVNRDNEMAREQIANTLGMEKLDVLQQRYLRDLRAAAFIDRRI